MTRRVVITGIGLVSPHGDCPEAVFSALLAGQSAIERWEPDGVPAVVVARAPFDATRWFTRLQLAGVDRVSQLAVAAAEMACVDAGVTTLDEMTGVYVGTGMGGAAAIEGVFRADGRVPPLSVPAFMPNAAAAHIAMRKSLHGVVYTYSIACASSAVAIAEAAKAIANGEIDAAIAGGSEALLVTSVVRAWQALRTLASADGDNPSNASRPFSSERTGLVLGEGAAFLMLESYESAIARGARIYAELAGSGVSCDATHLTKPDSAGQVRALVAALKNSKLVPSEVGYCNAHGTATLIGDVVECESLRAVWGENLSSLAVSSSKSMHGHLLGAAGALEAAITAMAIYYQSVPPNMHCAIPDPLCDVPLIREPNTRMPSLRAAISNSFAFGGTNAVLAFRRVD